MTAQKHWIYRGPDFLVQGPGCQRVLRRERDERAPGFLFLGKQGQRSMFAEIHKVRVMLELGSEVRN